ncbi:hypothetical protein [Halobellus rufus]|uniref:hypothetical protein n=1 Tax=Halobellus rufus TaxID=1448860 RepID=UPI000679735B|nr:hypothetical protein [Halobellus rufus]
MWGRLTDRLGPSGLAVVGSGSIEVGAKVLLDLPWLLDSTLGAVAASVVINLGIRNQFLLAGSQILFLVVSFYAFLPTVLPGDAGARAAREPPYRAALALVAGFYSLPVVLLSTGIWTTVGWSARLVGVSLVASTVLLLGVVAVFLDRTQSEPLTDPSGEAHVIVREGRGDSHPTSVDPKRLGSLPRWQRTGRTLVLVTGTSASHVSPMVLLGFLGGALNAVFPVLELVILCGLILRSGGGETDSRLSSSLPAVEDTFYDHLTVVTRGSTSAAGTITAVIGVLAPVGTAVILLDGGYLTPQYAISAWGRAFEYLGRWLFATVRPATVLDGFVAAVAASGELLAIPLAATAAVWFWFREIQRLPALSPPPDGTNTDPARADPVPARPVGMLLPAAALALARRLEIELTVGSLRGVAASGTVELLFAAGWLLLALLIFATIRWTPTDGRDAESIDALTEGPPMFVAAGATLVIAYALIVPLSRILPLTAVVVLLLAWLYYLTPVDRWADANADRPVLVVLAYGLVLVSISVPAVVLDVAPPIVLGLVVVPVLVVVGHRTPGEPSGESDRSASGDDAAAKNRGESPVGTPPSPALDPDRSDDTDSEA